MIGAYNPWLIALSIIVAAIASYVALDLAARIAAAKGSKAACELVHPDYQGAAAQRLRVIRRTNRPSPLVEEKVLRLDGTAIDVEVSAAPCVYENQPGYQEVMRDITARKLAEQELIRLAQYDQLTGLPNRTVFHDRLALAVARAARSGHMMALLYLDLDRFKAINDTLGHEAGDKVLQTAARRISAFRSIRSRSTSRLCAISPATATTPPS